MKKFFLLLLLLGCTGHSHPSQRINPISGKIVTNVIEFVSSPAWRASGYARVTDVETPFKLIVAGDNTVCPVMTLGVKPVLIGDVYHCQSQWRIRQ